MNPDVANTGEDSNDIMEVCNVHSAQAQVGHFWQAEGETNGMNPLDLIGFNPIENHLGENFSKSNHCCGLLTMKEMFDIKSKETSRGQTVVSADSGRSGPVWGMTVCVYHLRLFYITTYELLAI